MNTNLLRNLVGLNKRRVAPQVESPEPAPLPSVMERAYAADDAFGEPQPTMNYMNPMWAAWWDKAKDASGGENPVFGRRGSSLNKLPNSDSVNGIRRAGGF